MGSWSIQHRCTHGWHSECYVGWGKLLTSAGLFHQAIFQSSSFEGDYFFQPSQRAQDFGASWAKHIGCDADELGAENFLTCLRNVKAENLIEGTMYPSYPSVRPTLFPVLP